MLNAVNGRDTRVSAAEHQDSQTEERRWRAPGSGGKPCQQQPRVPASYVAT